MRKVPSGKLMALERGAALETVSVSSLLYAFSCSLSQMHTVLLSFSSCLDPVAHQAAIGLLRRPIMATAHFRRFIVAQVHHHVAARRLSELPPSSKSFAPLEVYLCPTRKGAHSVTLRSTTSKTHQRPRRAPPSPLQH